MSRLSTSKLWMLLIVTFAIYFLQGTLYPSGSIFSQGLVLLILLIGLYSLCKTFSGLPNAPRLMFWAALFFCMLGIAFVLSPKSLYASSSYDYISTLSQFKEAAVFVLSLFTGYQIGKKKILSDKQLYISTLIITGVCVVQYFKTELEVQTVTASEEVTNNSAYTFLALLCFIPMLAKHYKKTALILSGMVLAFVMAGAKRGAILCLLFMAIYCLAWYKKYYGISIKNFIAIIVVLCAVSGYVMYSFSESQYLQKRLDSTLKGNSSGRDHIYEDLWNAWIDNPNVAEQVIGKGSAQTVPIAGNFAHNDWLEVLIDNGLLGVITYIMMFASTLIFMRRNTRYIDPYCKLAMMLCLLLWFMKSLFSMGYTSAFNGLITMLLGLLIGNTVLKRRILTARK